ncbi:MULTISPECIES: helix-turn-helix domain-containing protein [Vibrio]|uniref:HTH cro/C1-type domain-containing protein n=1 Tax=Vibrio proteolyticus NBRC 13287 TaxID=1219065 RepID=U3A529_VIBPR|nr:MULTISPECIES: helix-turn-helix transcriptional regulator [Vibrio]NAW56371.1 XRE family transcriptional regulator [Vibrio sp. V36_P2S2PM302]NAX22180.1 XRE family transcriptional regulator [Vibrio sp. V39_P1S14PM300]NAX27440.1 XRE family transcriptional regulator [Vibrio sp. V38_P2S17PM301]NAX29423.1 XRE family transcriptional regulator [Vibrio sp. V37_P2S8PM304]GAD68442.1 hypothetical protein VPR01S_13_01070 [Vibrio proteolyticus NBRC 13287]
MEFTDQDREALYNIWMSQKAKLRLTQMEVAKRLGMNQIQFSELLRGSKPLSLHFIEQFCQQLHVNPNIVIPSLKEIAGPDAQVVHLQNRVRVDGKIQRVYCEGNEVIIDYIHEV